MGDLVNTGPITWEDICLAMKRLAENNKDCGFDPWEYWEACWAARHEELPDQTELEWASLTD